MKFKSIKAVSVLAVGLAAGLLFSTSAYAEVYTEKTGGGRADTIYIAGNPDRYPVEYFDMDSETYQGLVPELLELISQETEIDFTYISAGSENLQKSLYKNHQVDMVTAIASTDAAFANMEREVILTTEVDGEIIEYGIGFTEVISHVKKDRILNALSEISEAQKTGLLIKNVRTDLLSAQKRFAVIATIVILLAVGTTAAVLTTVIRKRKKKLQIDRMIDAETGIGNSDYYTYAFENLISEQAKNLYSLAYISFDTKLFEEQKGDGAADEIVKYAATKLSAGLRTGDYLFYLQQGTFALLFQAENEEIADRRMSELVAGVNKYVSGYVADSKELFKAGYCRFCDSAGIDAETAVYNAKQGYKYAAANDLPYYIGSKDQIAANRKAQRLMEQIDDGLKNDEFKLYMQFFLDAKTEKLCGAEVLSRWQNSEYGLLRPSEYIDILSKNGKIVEHDYKIFEKVCAILEKWNQPPFDRIFLSCNFTRLSVSNKDFAKRLAEISQNFNFSRSRLVVEITENSLNSNADIVSENIRQLRTFGFQVAIDDMGTGISSLADIYDNEIDYVKIESDFVSSCVTERRRKMLSNLILLAHNAGAGVICEGVETAEQLKMLQDMECDILQGFYHSRVLPFSECERFFLSKLD